MTRRLTVAALLPLAVVLHFGMIERAPAPQRGVQLVGPVYGPARVTQRIDAAGGSLTGIDVRIATYARRNEGVVTLRVHQGDAQRPLRVASVAARELQDNALHRFAFEALSIPHGEGGVEAPAVYVTLESSAPDERNAIAVWAFADDALSRGPSSEDSAPAPRVTFNGVPLPLNLVHSLVYAERGTDRLSRAAGALAVSGPGPLVGALTVLLPGAAMARMCLGPAARAALIVAAAPAFGLALVALVMLWAGVLGVRIGQIHVIAVGLASAVGLAALERGRWAGARESPPHPYTADLWAGAVALAAVVLGLGVRAAALEGIATPPGADSFHHTLITQLIMDQGGVPADYRPYVPIRTFTYHFGFHAAAAWAGAAIGWDSLRATVTMGTLLNGLVAFSLFGAALLAGLGPVTAAVAAVVVALVSPFPMWFLDVGRFPQEAALVILPLAAVIGCADRWADGGAPSATPANSGRPFLRPVLTWSRRPGGTVSVPMPQRGPVGPVIGGVILAAGLFLTHYRVTLMLVALFLLSLLGLVLGRWRRRAGSWRVRALRTCAIAAGAAVLVAPWVVRLAQGFTLGIRESQGRYAPAYYNPERLGTALADPALVGLAVLAALGIALAVAGRAWLLGLLGAWGAALLLGSDPHRIGAPGVGMVDTVTVISSLAVMGALAVGYTAQRLWDAGGEGASPSRCEGQWSRAARLAARPLMASVVGLAAGWGALQLPGLVRPEQSLATPADIRAAEWITQHLPADARILVNASIVRWEPDFVEPTDAGVWLPLIADRAVTLLPLVYAGERGAEPGDIARMERIARALRGDLGEAATLRLFRESGVTHVYLGARGGPIDERQLAESPAYRRVYTSGGVSVYELVEGTGDDRGAR